MNLEAFDGPFGVKAQFCFRPDIADRNTILATFHEDEYNFVRYPAGPGEWYIDGGGYVGSTAILYALLNPKTPVLVIEPLPENQEIIMKNISINGLTNRVTLIKGALTDVPGQPVKIYYRDDSPVGKCHHFVGSGYPNYHETVSPNFTLASPILLDQLITEFSIDEIRLLKLDIEGGEYAALQSLGNLLLARIRTIVGEYHNVDPKNCLTPRTKLYKIVENTHQDFSVGAEVATWGSFLFEKRG